MYEFRCNENGIIYYDPLVRSNVFASNTMLFLLGYARVFGDVKVSDKLFIPHTILDSNGVPVSLSNYSFLLSARAYLNTLSEVEITDTGDVFDLYGLPLVLEPIGYLNYYHSSTQYNAGLDRVPHVPLFTKRSQDFKRVHDILTQERYWSDGQSPSKGIYEKYSIYNTQYKGNRGEFLDLYHSFGSMYFMDTLYPSELKPVSEYPDMCSWFIWDSLSFTSLYQFSLGVLYGMSQLGWGLSPFLMRPKEYNPYFKYYQLVDEAFFWYQNTPVELTGRNELYSIDPNIFRIDTNTLIGG